MKNKIIALGILCMLGLASYSFTSIEAADCFTYFKRCNNYAEEKFNSGPLSQSTADEYLEDVIGCLGEYDTCSGGPRE